mgnify:FL=1
MQRNACAALTAIMNASTILYHTVAEAPDLVVTVAKVFHSLSFVLCWYFFANPPLIFLSLGERTFKVPQLKSG